jgi:hypothetical protein
VTESESESSLRSSSMVRGVAIGALMATYAWATHQSTGSYKSGLIVAIALQLAVLAVRRFVPTEQIGRAIYICEMLADGATVLLFALGVYGGTMSIPPEL